MKKIITIYLLFFGFCAKAQLFSGSPGGILNHGEFTYFNLSVAGLSHPVLDSTFGLEEVCLTINHPVVSELYISLQSPSGTIVQLTSGSSSAGSNFTSTCFQNSASSSVTLGTAPYTGVYQPVGSLGRFQNGQIGNGIWKLVVHDYLAFVDSGNVVSWSITFGNAPAHPVSFSSSNLPIVFLNTSGLAVTDSARLVNMGIVWNGAGVRNYITDPWNNYNGKAMIHTKGNSTKDFEKRSMGFETRDFSGIQTSSSLLGMPMESDWILSAPYQDKTLMRIQITYNLFREMGHYASRTKNVELVMNNEYQGVYTFCEKLKRDKNRVDISKLTPVDNAFPEVTGGYIFEIDKSDSPGWASLLPGDSPTGSHFYYQYVYPKDSDITVQQKTYIQNFVDTFELVMNSPTYADPVIGYSKYIDVNSFVDFFIINELSKNVDAYRLSTYIYKDKISKGGKLHIGPVWDYDIAWHNCNYADSFDQNYWQYLVQDTVHPVPTWWRKFMQDTTFTNQLYCRWHELRQNILSLPNLYAYIDSSAFALDESQQRNFLQWPIIGAYIFPNPQNQAGASYAGEVGDLKNWIAGRIGWMDAAIGGHCMPTGIDEETNINVLAIYPNPFRSSTTFSIRLAKDANVSLKIMDLMGKDVASLINEHRPSGETKINFDGSRTAAGIYLYQLKINDELKAGKIIIE